MYYFIVNPNARSGMGLSTWKLLEQELDRRQVLYQVFFTKYQNHASLLARELTQESSCRSLFVLGGDGTLNETVNGISDLSRITLGYIPIGSSNDFARSLGLERDPLKALPKLLTPSQYVSVNIGALRYQGKKRRFAVSAGMGFDAGVCHQVAVSPLKGLLNKIKLGKLSYAAVAVGRLLSLTPARMTITLDGKQKLEFQKAYFAAAMNHPYEGGGFRFCPKADPSDDILDVVVVADLPKLKVLLLLPTTFKGWHIRFKGAYVFQCRQFDVLSEKPLPVHTDGEPVVFQRHMAASLESQKLRLIKT